MQIKKLKLFVILFFLMTFLLSTGLMICADNKFTVSISNNNTAVRGDSFTVDISFSGNTGFTEMNISLNYDGTVMSLKDISFSSFLTVDESITCTVNKNTISIKSSDEPIKRNGVVATATFVLDNKAKIGNYKIKPSLNGDGIKDQNGNAIDCTFLYGLVEISCYHNYKKTVYKPTCNSEGYTEYRCTECSITYISDYVDKIAHSWKTVSTIEPSCTEAGTIVRECKVCGEREEKVNGEATGHSYSSGEVTSPTCTSEGYTTYVCSKCGKTFRDSYTPVSNHRYIKTYTEEASCSHTGFELYSCEYCGSSYQITIPTLEHQWIVENHNSTHTEEGWSLYTCSSCGLSMRGNFSNKLEYKLIWSVTKEATCDCSGLKTGVCSDGCGYTVTEEIPTLGHSFDSWVNVSNASVVKKGIWESKCSRCGKTIQKNTDYLTEIKHSSCENTSSLKSFVNKILDSELFYVAVSVLFLLILISIILHIIKRRKDKTAVDMLKFANEFENEFKDDKNVPANLPDSFVHDFEDFDLPKTPFNSNC